MGGNVSHSRKVHEGRSLTDGKGFLLNHHPDNRIGEEDINKDGGGEVNENKCPIKKSQSGLRRNLDGKHKGLKVRTELLTCSWKENCRISILNHVLRIEDTENQTMMQMVGDLDKIEIGGFQMSTRHVTEEDGRKGYCLGIDTKVLNLATFEIEVRKEGTIILKGRKLRESKEGQLKIATAPQVLSKDIVIDALDNNRTVWVRIYYINPSIVVAPPPFNATGQDCYNDCDKDNICDKNCTSDDMELNCNLYTPNNNNSSIKNNEHLHKNNNYDFIQETPLNFPIC